MYAVYVDNNLLYSPDLANDGYVILSPKVTYELNKAGSFSFTLPPNNPLYSNISKLVSIVTIWDDDDEIFRGRVLNDEKDFYNRKKVYCEGELSFLLDSVIRPYDFTGDIPVLFEQFITNHNSQVEEVKQFTVGEITVTDPNEYIVRSSTDYVKTWDEMNDKFLDLLGGYFRIRKSGSTRYIDYLESYDHISNQVIEFGVNMLDISQYISADDVFTVLIPLGVKDEDTEEYLTISDVNNGLDYLVDEDAVQLFGYVWEIHEWEDVTLAENLLTKGKAYLESGVEMAVSLTMNAVDLHLLEVDTDRITLGDYVRVISIPHKIDEYFLCSKIDLDLVNPDSSEYTFGYSFTTMTEKTLNTSSTMKSSVASAVASATSAAQAAATAASESQSAAEEAKNVVVSIPDEYVKIETFEAYKTEISNKITAVYRFKGTVDDYNSLPTSNDIGDTYNLLDTGANYAWTSNGWDKLSETIDLSGYVTLETYQALLARVEALEGTTDTEEGTDTGTEETTEGEE